MAGLPRLVQPMLATLRHQLPADDDRYGWEFKWDGVRAVAYVSGTQVRHSDASCLDVRPALCLGHETHLFCNRSGWHRHPEAPRPRRSHHMPPRLRPALSTGARSIAAAGCITGAARASELLRGA